MDYDDCIDFTLDGKRINGEQIPLDWLYWQVLVNDEPYIYKSSDFPTLSSIGGDTDAIPASLTLFAILPNYEVIDWGRIGEGEYRCYLPEYTPGDKIAVRAGCKVDSNPIQWSEEVIAVVSEQAPNKLPSNALYFTYATIDTEYGPFQDYGLAMFVDYGEETMTISGFFGRSGAIEGAYGDPLRRSAVINSNQVIGTSVDDLPIKIIAAKMALLDPTDPSSALVFTPVEDFTLNINFGGRKIKASSNDIYLLEVIGDEITNVWCPGLELSIVTDKVNEIPASATVEKAEMSYGDIRDDDLETEVLLATEGDNIWLEMKLNSNWYRDEDIEENVCLKGVREADRFVFELPQYLGLTQDNYISYASADVWTFNPSQLIFEKDATTGLYIGYGELWIGNGLGYPIKRLARNMVIDLKNGTVEVDIINDDIAVDFVDGAFVASDGSYVEVFNVAGMKVANSDLTAGTYIVVVNGKTKKIHVR